MSRLLSRTILHQDSSQVTFQAVTTVNSHNRRCILVHMQPLPPTIRISEHKTVDDDRMRMSSGLTALDGCSSSMASLGLYSALGQPSRARAPRPAQLNCSLFRGPHPTDCFKGRLPLRDRQVRRISDRSVMGQWPVCRSCLHCCLLHTRRRSLARWRPGDRQALSRTL